MKTKPVMMLLIILWMFCLGMLGMGFHVHSDRGTAFYAALVATVGFPTFFSVMTALVIFFPLRFFPDGFIWGSTFALERLYKRTTPSEADELVISVLSQRLRVMLAYFQSDPVVYRSRFGDVRVRYKDISGLENDSHAFGNFVTSCRWSEANRSPSHMIDHWVQTHLKPLIPSLPSSLSIHKVVREEVTEAFVSESYEQVDNHFKTVLIALVNDLKRSHTRDSGREKGSNKALKGPEAVKEALKGETIKKAETYLKPEMTLEEIEEVARKEGDNFCAARMQKAKKTLFESFKEG